MNLTRHEQFDLEQTDREYETIVALLRKVTGTRGGG